MCKGGGGTEWMREGVLFIIIFYGTYFSIGGS